jgi:uncharacterized protein (DUF58 family)
MTEAAHESLVERPLRAVEGRLTHDFGQRRVRVARTREVFGRGAELHRDRDLGDEVACPCTDDVGPEDAVRVAVGEDLRDAIGLTKRERARLLALAVASLAVRAQERVSALGSPYAPDHARSQLVKIADWFLKSEGSALPSFTRMPRFSSAVLAGDFFDRLEDIAKALTPLAQAGVKGHLVQVVDPAEETLPYAGRVEFQEMAGPIKFLSAKAETLRNAYADKLANHRAGLADLCNRLGWSFSIHRTDAAPATMLLSLHALIAGERGR